MKHLKNIWDGMGLISSVLSEPKAYPDARNGFARDHARLIRDARRVADELNEKAEKVYGKWLKNAV